MDLDVTYAWESLFIFRKPWPYGSLPHKTIGSRASSGEV